jgi:DNA-binding transcriptional MerR regulator
VEAGLSIGEFSAVTQLSIRTLRHYHEIGVLSPVRIDAHNGYRYYAADQIPTAQVVHRLRQLELPLPEIKEILATDDLDRRAELISAHLERLEGELDRTRAAVVALQQLLRAAGEALVVELRSVPKRTAAAISATVQRQDVSQWYDAAMTDLDAAVPPDRRLGPPGGRYANELFTEEAGDVMVFYPVSEAAASGRVEVLLLPPVELAVTVHAGGHEDIPETYGRLGRWVTEHALAVAGPVHETYLVGPRESSLKVEWRTEIGWPVFRLATG